MRSLQFLLLTIFCVSNVFSSTNPIKADLNSHVEDCLRAALIKKMHTIKGVIGKSPNRQVITFPVTEENVDIYKVMRKRLVPGAYSMFLPLAPGLWVPGTPIDKQRKSTAESWEIFFNRGLKTDDGRFNRVRVKFYGEVNAIDYDAIAEVSVTTNDKNPLQPEAFCEAGQMTIKRINDGTLFGTGLYED